MLQKRDLHGLAERLRRQVEISLEVIRKGGAGSADYSGVPGSVTFSSVQT